MLTRNSTLAQLVFIEAAAHGLPWIGTQNGGPFEINRTLQSGLLIDPASSASITDALVKLLTDRQLWLTCRKSGLERIGLYSWDCHVRRHMAVLDSLDKAAAQTAAQRRGLCGGSDDAAFQPVAATTVPRIVQPSTSRSLLCVSSKSKSYLLRPTPRKKRRCSVDREQSWPLILRGSNPCAV